MQINRLLGIIGTLALIVPLASDGWAKDKERVLEQGKWYIDAEGGVNLTQSSYSSNWAGGDKGSVVWTLIFNSNAENQLKEKLNWLNTLKLAFGQAHQQSVDSEGNREWDKPQKTTDLIDFETTFRFTLGKWFDPYFSGRFESQFIDASDPFGRELTVNPFRVKEAGGVARKFINKENKSLLSRFGFAFRQNFRKLYETADPNDDATTSEITNDGGVEWVTDYKTKIFEDKVSWNSKLSFFQPMFYSAQDDFDGLAADSLGAAGLDGNLADFTMALDVDWENIFSAQITKYISVNFYVRWIYDKYDNSVPVLLDDNGSITNSDAVGASVRKAGQFKQTMAIGITYRFL